MKEKWENDCWAGSSTTAPLPLFPPRPSRPPRDAGYTTDGRAHAGRVTPRACLPLTRRRVGPGHSLSIHPHIWVSSVWAQLVGSIPFLALAHAPGPAYLATTNAATSAARIGRIPLTVPTARPESPRSRVLIGPNPPPPVVSHYEPGYSTAPSSASVLVSASTPTGFVPSPSPSWRQPLPRPTPASRTPTRSVPSPTARPPRSNPPATRFSAASAVFRPPPWESSELRLNPRMKASEHHLSIAQLILAVGLMGDHRGWLGSLTVAHASLQDHFVPWTGDAAAQSKVMVTPHNPHHPRFALHRVDWQTVLCSIKACGSGEPPPRSQGRHACVSIRGRRTL
jgi:hypothetical protein